MGRVIMHIDMNSYFATVEQQANPFLRGKPIGVGGPVDGRSVVAAASVEAKKYGIKAGMSIYEARRACPTMIFVQGDYHKYAACTDRILKIFRRYTPILEVFSIDEAFLDVTQTIGSFEGAVEAVREIKTAIQYEVGEWLRCSAGIAPNKLIAKLASDLKKPDGLVVVEEKNIPKLLSRIALDDLCGIGRRMKRNLLQMGIDTVGKLGSCPLEVLVRRFGKVGFVLHRMGRGEDDTPVHPYYEIEDPKSMGHTYTLPRDEADPDKIWSTLLKLSEQVGRRLRAENFRGRRVSAGIGLANFQGGMHKQKAMKRWTDDGYEIFLVAKEIIESFHYNGPIRRLGVSVSGLVKDVHQLTFLPEEVDREKLTRAVDKINNKFGEFTVGRGLLMLTRMKKGTSGLGANRAISRQHRREDYRAPEMDGVI